jgi:hypothetical protein
MFGIRDRRSWIRKKPILDPGSRVKKSTGSRTATLVVDINSIKLHAENLPDQMSVDIVHVDAGEEELVEDDGAEVLVFELLTHRDQRRHHAVHERVLRHTREF